MPGAITPESANGNQPFIPLPRKAASAPRLHLWQGDGADNDHPSSLCPIRSRLKSAVWHEPDPRGELAP